MTYQVHVRPRRGIWARWQGRIVTIDPTGRRRHWRTRSARRRETLIATLWAEAMFDIKWHTDRADAVIIEHEAA